MTNKAECLQFVYDNHMREEEFELNTQLQFSAQNPIDKTLLQRAIIVKFRAQRDDKKFQLICVCRVIFEFSSSDELLEGKELLRLHQKDAYIAATEMINRVLIAMGQERMDFPEI